MERIDLGRRAAAAGALASGWAGPALARQARPALVPVPRLPPPPPPGPTSGPISGPVPGLAAPPVAPAAPPTPEELVDLDLLDDVEGRMRVAVRVDGRGPFPFMIDTGADHSVLSQELAAALGLRPAGAVPVHGIAGSVLRPRARVARLEVGGRRLDDQALALLARRDLGALGLVGLDVLRRQRVVVDFARRSLEVRRSRGPDEEPGAVVVRGRSRFGQLLLVDSTVRRRPVFAVLDTGAQNTMGNAALRAMLYAGRRARGLPDPRRRVELISVTGGSVWGEVDEMPELTLGRLAIHHVPVVYADLDTFRLFGLVDEPALMLGMDVLRSFRQVTIDFARRETSFTLPPAAT